MRVETSPARVASVRSAGAGVERRPPAVAYGLSGALAALLLVASAAGLFAPGLYRDTPGWVAQARGVNLVDLLVALPALLAAMVWAARGSLRARVIWMGMLAYVLYNYAIFAFAVALNPLFLVYTGALSLAAFALLALLTALDVDALRARFAATTPVRAVSGFLLAVAALFFLAWMKDLIPATFGGPIPGAIVEAGIPTNPVYALDLAFLLPLCALAALWLLRGRAWGYALAGLLLTLTAPLALSIAASALFQGGTDPGSVAGAILPFAVVGLLGAGLTVAYLRGLRGAADPEPRPERGAAAGLVTKEAHT
jgi:hypothetical protein